MRYVRCHVDGHDFWGVLRRDNDVTRLTAAPWLPESQPLSERHLVSEVYLLAPVEPSKILAVGRNYADHASEMGGHVAEQPRIFFKPPSSVIGPGQPIVLPPASISREVHYEAELAVVIGSRCRNVASAHAESVIFGYTCANDVTARDIQRRDGLPDYAKSFDTFCPLGPWLDTALDRATARVRCLVNGVVAQDGRVDDMLTPLPALISHISRAMTLLPGDVILTGTPAGVGPIVHGDDVTVEISGIGALASPVVGHQVE